jgi:putative transposase
MPNHIHWVFYLKERSIDNKEVYLQDILHSVKLFTAREINKNESRNGRLWSEESFDTTIRNENHLHNVIKYILYNPVKARLVKRWSEWAGNYINPKYLNEIEIEFGESDD